MASERSSPSPPTQVELAAQAAARGMEIPEYAATLLEQAAQPLSAGLEQIDIQRLRATLDEMTQFSHKIPSLPDLVAFAGAKGFIDRN